jgi:hypothetical protein
LDVAPVGAALLLALLSPLASAHIENETTYDPLQLNVPLWLAANGTLAESAPAAGARYLPPTDPTATSGAPSLEFSIAAPLPFTLRHGLDVTLRLQADEPIVAQDANGTALDVAIERNGAIVNGSTRALPLGKPALAPGDVVTVRALLPAPDVLFARQDELALTVRATLPLVPSSSLKVLVGPDGSTATLDDLQVPSVRDLDLEDGGLFVFDPRNETFTPPQPDAVVYTGVVGHASVDVPAIDETDGRFVYLVLRGDEPPAQARAEHDAFDASARRAAAHAFTVGSTVVRVHPGVAVVVPVGRGPDPVPIACAANCPVPGYRATITFGSGAGGASGSQPDVAPTSVLMPPPPGTSGIPVSKDAPAPKPAPAASLAAVVGAVMLATLLRRTRIP